MKRGLILLPIILAILAFSALALDVTYTPVQDKVLPGQQAKYLLKITNNEAAETQVVVKSIDLNWQLDNDGAKFNLKPKEYVEFNAVYTPVSNNMKPGKYGVNYRIESQSKTLFNDFLPVTVVRYDEVVDAAFNGKALIDPLRNSLVKLDVTNLQPIDLLNLDVKVESDAFKDSKTLNLIKNEKDTLEFQISPNPNIKEGDYVANIIVMLGDKQLLNKPLNVVVGRYNDLQEVSEPAEGFLILGEKTTLNNNGNSLIENILVKKLSWIQSKFTKFEPAPSTIEQKADGYIYVQWNYALQPGESETYSYSTNYRNPIIYAILFVIIVGGIYLLRKKDLAVTKRALSLHTTEGNLAIMKVLVTVKNNGNSGIDDIKVMDKVPGLIKAPVEFGMIKPSSVKNVGEHTVLVWDIPHLKKGEERVISYKIEGRVNILDTIVLPAALAKFGIGTKKKMFSSRSVSLNKHH